MPRRWVSGGRPNMSSASGNVKQLWVGASAFAATLCVLTAVSASAGPFDWAAGLPGCDPSRPAVAHHAKIGAVDQVLVPQPTNGPVPCGVLTGWATNENRIEVTNDGTVIFMPALIPDPLIPLLAGCGNGAGFCATNSVARTA